MWDLAGKRVEVRTVSGETRQGVVESSRIKYGGILQHTVRLDQPITYRWRAEAVDVVLATPDAIKVL